MSATMGLALAGVLATILFGAWAIILAVRHGYPGQITFVKEQTIALFDEIVRNLPDLSVLYRQAPISPNLILVRAALVNTGKKDIAASMVDDPLTLLLPSDCKWLSPTIIGTSRGVNASLDQPHDTRLILKASLLRCKEFVRFQALAEVPPAASEERSAPRESSEKRFGSTLRFEHRIQDTQPVRRVVLGELEKTRKRLRLNMVLPGIGLVLVIIMSFFASRTGFFKQLAYQFQREPGKTVSVTVQMTGGPLLSVRSLDGSFRDRLPPQEFFQKCSGAPTVIEDRSGFVLVLCVVTVFYVILPSTIAIASLWQYRSEVRLRRILGAQ
jgi:hypothetical protein